MGDVEQDDSFDVFASTVARPLFEMALLLSGDWHLSQDLVQDTLARIYAAWPMELEYPLAYARKTLLHSFLSQRRRRSSTERPSEALPDGCDSMPDLELRQSLLDALRRLPERERVVVVLRYWADRSVEQVARELGRSPATVRSQAWRGLARLNEDLKASYADLFSSARPRDER